MAGMSADGNREEVNSGLWGFANRLLVVLIGLSLLAAAAVSYLPLIHQNRALRERLQHLQAQAAEGDAELRNLHAQHQALQRDPRTVERALREMGMSRPDEIIVRFETGVR